VRLLDDFERPRGYRRESAGGLAEVRQSLTAAAIGNTLTRFYGLKVEWPESGAQLELVPRNPYQRGGTYFKRRTLLAVRCPQTV
jgi:hypothetical protein